MTWTSLSFSFGAVLTSSQMNQLQANFAAMAAGDSGAPEIEEPAMADNSISTRTYVAGSVDQTAMGSGAVHRDELSTGTEEESTNADAAGGTEEVFTSQGGYGFFPELRISSATAEAQIITDAAANDRIFYSSGSSYGTLNIRLRCTNVARTAYLRIRYINSSPPYDLGDGEIGRFVYAEIKPNGDIIRVWNSDDPPWRKDVITGKLYKDRKTEKTYVYRPTIDIKRWGEIADNKIEMDNYISALKNITWEWVELTNADKIRPMVKRPSPWQNKNSAQNTQIIIDPVSPILHNIQELMNVDNDISPAALLHEGYLKIGNEPLNRATPPGVQAYPIKWR